MSTAPDGGEWTIEFVIDRILQPARFKIDSELYIGRTEPDQTIFDGLDLAAYQGRELGVSRHHAVIRVHGSDLLIVDLHSSNGTRLNGTRLEPDVEYRLTDGDQLAVGRLMMVVHFSNNLGWSSILGKRTELRLHNAPLKGRGQRILIVDDDRSFSDLYRVTFELAGYSVSCCRDVVSAIRILKTSSPDLILLDLMLGSVSGLEFCRYARRDTDNPGVPIVVISGATGDAIQQALDAGANVYIGKPTNIAELIRVVAFLIHKRETENPALGTKELSKTATLQSSPSPVVKNAVVIFIEDSREPIGITVDNQILLGRRDGGRSNHLHGAIDLASYGAFEKGVSRAHARLIRKGETFLIEDLASSNGTYLNGKSLNPNRPTAINTSDEIRLGELRMRVYFVPECNLKEFQSSGEVGAKPAQAVAGL